MVDLKLGWLGGRTMQEFTKLGIPWSSRLGSMGVFPRI